LASTAGQSAAPTMKGGRPRVMGGKAYARRSKYVMFIVPATIITIAVILFPWVFTLWMSLNDWTIGSSQTFVGLDNFTKLATDQRFLSSIPRTMYYTVLAVVLPVIFGTLAAVVFNQHFPLRGLLRGIFIMPMMATPVAIALVWTMMFHPQLGVLNYMLSLVGIPEQMWVYSQDTVIPALVMVEIWNWTPLIMVIMLGGLAVLPIEPYESAVIDGANPWNIFWHITFPLVLPFLMVAVILRTIDALKAFDTIFVITQGGPGTASETINILLYLQAFAYYKIGSASAMVVVFFVIIVLLSLVMLYVRQKTLWTE